ncbi:MAG: CDP-alcohol phosphatidyltransferase family protein [Phycisphaerales bacterium]
MIKQIPNILTGGRLVLAVIFLIMILIEPTLPQDRDYSFPGYLDYAFILFVIAGLTDLFDGYAARKLNVASKFGRIVDPLADKILIVGSFIVFAIIGEPKLFSLTPFQNSVVQWGFVSILMLREATVTVVRHLMESRGIKFPATWSGKLKMFVQAFAVGTVLVKMAHVQTATWGYWFTTITYIATIFVTVMSGYLSLRKVKTH